MSTNSCVSIPGVPLRRMSCFCKAHERGGYDRLRRHCLFRWWCWTILDWSQFSTCYYFSIWANACGRRAPSVVAQKEELIDRICRYCYTPVSFRELSRDGHVAGTRLSTRTHVRLGSRFCRVLILPTQALCAPLPAVLAISA